MSPRGGKRPGQRGREKVDEALHFQRRYFSLPPDVIEELDKVPNGERSRLVATLLREYFRANNSQHDSHGEKQSNDPPTV